MRASARQSDPRRIPDPVTVPEGDSELAPAQACQRQETGGSPFLTPKSRPEKAHPPTEERWLPAQPCYYRKPKSCQFVNGQQFLTLATEAYVAASLKLLPPSGEPWIVEGGTWAHAADFYDHLCAEISERLRVAARASRDLVEVPADER